MPPIAVANQQHLGGGSSSPQSSPWFEGAPITKLCCILWIVGHVAVGPSSLPLLFGSTGELIMGVLFLAQQLKSLERELSSRQLIVWLLWITALSGGWMWMASSTMGVVAAPYYGNHHYDTNDDDDSFSFASGPYPWMGGILCWYLQYVPRLYPRFVSVLGITFSEKALQFIWAVYLMGSQGLASIVPGVFGFVAAAVYFFLVPHYVPLTLPDAVVKSLPWESLGGLLFLDPPPKVHVPMMMTMNNMAGGAGGGRDGGGRGNMRQARSGAAAAAIAPPSRPPPVAPSPPPQEAVDQLTAMGFDEERVKQALQQTNNSVERAADRLLTG